MIAPCYAISTSLSLHESITVIDHFNANQSLLALQCQSSKKSKKIRKVGLFDQRRLTLWCNLSVTIETLVVCLVIVDKLSAGVVTLWPVSLEINA